MLIVWLRLGLGLGLGLGLRHLGLGGRYLAPRRDDELTVRLEGG